MGATPPDQPDKGVFGLRPPPLHTPLAAPLSVFPVSVLLPLSLPVPLAVSLSPPSLWVFVHVYVSAPVVLALVLPLSVLSLPLLQSPPLPQS